MFSKSAPSPAAATAGALTAKRSWSLATQLTIWYACSAFSLIFLTTAFLYRTLGRNLDQEEDLFLADHIQDIGELVKEQPDNITLLTQEVAEGGQYIRIYTRVLTERGEVIVETPGMSHVLSAGVFPKPIHNEANPGSGTNLVSQDGQPYRGLTAQENAGPSGRQTRIIQVAMGQAKKRGLLAKYRRRLGNVLGSAFCICVLIGYQIARRGIRPIQDISRTAQRIRSTTLHQRISTKGLPNELLTLAAVFNELLAHLEESFSRLSQFSANIAHELRTPVHNLRGIAEVALRSRQSPEEYQDVLGSCLEECLRLSRLIDSVLFLARAEQSQMAIQREPLEVVHELTVVRDFYESAATEAGVALTIDAQPPLNLSLDRTLFQRAVGNLISNALAYTSRGGTIALSAAKAPKGVRIGISDTGCGIPAEQLHHVFDRFYRVHRDGISEATKGMGLGLAIVKSIVELHQGSVSISSLPDLGTQVTMLFPA